MYSACLCSKKRSVFTPYIIYKNETVFKDFEGIIIGKCNTCGLLKTFSPDNAHFNPEQSRKDMYESQKSFFMHIFAPIVKKIKEYKTSGSVLDVGCSSGILLELLKKEKFDIYGIEPNKKAFELANRKFRNRIFNGTLSQFRKHTHKQFDVIIYNHVLEHIENIRTEIIHIKQVLKKNGILVLGVPNTDNIIFYLRKKYWEPLMLLEHVWHFSRSHLVKYLKRNGFLTRDISFSNDDRLGYPFMKRVYFSFLSFINKLMYTGEAMLLIAQKIKRNG